MKTNIPSPKPHVTSGSPSPNKPPEEPKAKTSQTEEKPRIGQPRQASPEAVQQKASGSTGFHATYKDPSQARTAALGSPSASSPSTSRAVWHDPAGVLSQHEVSATGGNMKPQGASTAKVTTAGGQEFDLHKIDPRQQLYYFQQTPGPSDQHPHTLTRFPLEEDKLPKDNLPVAKGAYLAWEPGKAHVMDLKDLPKDVNFFVTAPMNACGLVIGGKPEAPVVMHANYDHPDLLPEHLMTHPKALAAHQLGMYKTGYPAMAEAAKRDGHIPAENSVMLEPNQYLKPDKGMSKLSVIGVRGDDGNWKMHYSATHQVKESTFWGFGKPIVTNKPLTGELWPNADFEPLNRA